MILNLHGLYGKSKNTNYSILEKLFSASMIISPQIDFESCPPYDIIDRLSTMKRIDYIVGNSFGGFFAYVVSAKIGCPCLLTNPCIPPTKYIRELIPKYPNESFEQLEEITESFCLDNSTQMRSNVFVILGKDDDILDPDFTSGYIQNAEIYRINGGHRLAGAEFRSLFKKIAISLQCENI